MLRAEHNIRGDLSGIFKILTETGAKVAQESAVNIAEEATLRVVGEAYKKWDSTSSCLPRLVSIFKEKGVTTGARRTQIKARLPQLGKDLTDEGHSTTSGENKPAGIGNTRAWAHLRELHSTRQTLEEHHLWSRSHGHNKYFTLRLILHR